MVYEDICNFGMDQLVITQYKKILKILQENSNILILKIPIEKVKSKEEKEREELQTKNCLIFKKLEKFFLESRLCRKNGTIIKREKGKKGYYMTDNWYLYNYNKDVRKVLQEYPNIYAFADWIDLCFVSENKIILQTIAHEGMCFGSAELFRDI